MKKNLYLVIILMTLATFFITITLNNIAIAQNGCNGIINISGFWVAEMASGPVNLQINQNGQTFTWGLEYVGQGLTSEGTGVIENRALLVETALPGRMAPSPGQIVNVNNNGYATSIELDGMLFTRTGE